MGVDNLILSGNIDLIGFICDGSTDNELILYFIALLIFSTSSRSLDAVS
jgi:hypothetical protein